MCCLRIIHDFRGVPKDDDEEVIAIESIITCHTKHPEKGIKKNDKL